MSDAPVVDYLREQFARVHAKLDRLTDDVQDLKRRMTSVGRQLGDIRVDMSGLSLRLDRLDAQTDRLERRMEIASA